MSTGEAILVEASPYDKIWGVGFGPNDPEINDPSKWPENSNLLGRTLMSVRDKLSLTKQNVGVNVGVVSEKEIKTNQTSLVDCDPEIEIDDGTLQSTSLGDYDPEIEIDDDTLSPPPPTEIKTKTKETKPGQIRVGKLSYPNYRHTEVPGFTPIYVMIDNGKYPDPYNRLSPFHIRDEHKRFMENIWQFSRIFPKARLYMGSKAVGPENQHYIGGGSSGSSGVGSENVTESYLEWRRDGATAKVSTRYSNGRANRGQVLHAYKEVEPVLSNDTLEQIRSKIDFSRPLDYRTSRYEIYLPLYAKMVQQYPEYDELQRRYLSGENLLILEVDGPFQSDLAYYQQRYGVKSDFITNHSMLATPENLKIMLDDTRHNFGHGYCLAMTLQGITATAT